MITISEHLQGYEYITDENTGKTVAVRRSTGEVTQAVQCCLPIGTISYTPESQEIYRERQEREKRNGLRRLVNNPLGNFYFVPISEQFSNIAPETVTRLIYLNTFIGYDNRLMLTERTPMKRKDLEEVLNLSKSTVWRFWQEVCPAYIEEQDNGLIFSNNTIFKRGKIKSTKEYIRYQKFYINGIRRLYETTERSNHRQLGYLFKLLPFINIEYNLVNPYVKQFDIAVSVVTTLINTLTEANNNIDSTIAGITDYQRELESTAAGLRSAKAKNEKVISNFGALLDVE